ncbi:MAG: hypothetical protein ACU0A6_12030 [Shimia sp.]|uniref:hypothetical protein n=1 Tax=Shimia sp. TaxID=1954381 RepID=UPI0040582037
MLSRLLLVLILFPAISVAQDHALHQQIGDWAVRIDPSNGNGCYAETSFESGTLVAIGLVPDENGAFFAAYNPNWPAVEKGAVSTVLFDFGDSRFQGEVLGDHRGDVPGGYAFFDNPEFALEFGKRTSVVIEGASGKTEAVELTGSLKALQGVKACQEEQPGIN